MTENTVYPRSEGHEAPWQPWTQLTAEQRAERNLMRALASIRYGVLDGMRLIRKEMMKPGEWDDPSIPSNKFLVESLLKCGPLSNDFNHLERARHQVALRWVIKREKYPIHTEGCGCGWEALPDCPKHRDEEVA